MVYFTFLSITSITIVLFSALISLFMFTREEKSPAQFHFGIGFAGMAIFTAAYFFAGSYYHPSAGYHRFVTGIFILPAITHLILFCIRFPVDSNPKLTRRFGFGMYGIAFFIVAYFLIGTIPTPIRFNFSSHIYNFENRLETVVLGIAILSFILAMIPVVLWRLRSGSKTLAYILFSILLSSLIPAYLNYLAAKGIISRGTWFTVFLYFVLIGFFMTAVFYVNREGIKSSFMLKIVGVTLVFVLLLFQGISGFLFSDAEISYDRLRVEKLKLAVSDSRYPEDLKYLISFTKPDKADIQSLPFILYKNPNMNAEAFSAIENIEPLAQNSIRSYRSLIPGKNLEDVTVFYLEANGKIFEGGYSYVAYRQEIHQVATRLLLSLIVAIFAILGLYPMLFRGMLITPLQRLLFALQQVNKGDLSVSVNVMIEDEIGFLSHSFNSMVTNIRDARDNLEQKIKDRTDDLQKAYDRLQEADQVKTNFFANISHELRTPLTLMITPLESMLQGEIGAMNKEQIGFVQSMLKNGQKLLRLINNLLDFSKLEAGRMTLSLKQAEMVAYVKELTSAFDSSARTKGIELKVEASQSKMKAFIDPDKMEKIILNLLSNSFKFTEKGGIYLSLKEIGDTIELTVRDTGIGIPSEKLESIFERFSQVDASASRKYEGTGIGLALAKELATLHNGNLVVTSTLGEGSSFILTFPNNLESKIPVMALETNFENTSASKKAILAEIEDNADKPQVVFQDDSGKYEVISEDQKIAKSEETVLIVEDTHDMRKLLYFLLKNHFNLITARNGREGMQKAKLHKPDLILSDVMMPEMNGYDLLKAIKSDEAMKTTPVILLTAKAEVDMKIEGLDQGADDYLIKPFNSQELLSRIRAQLRVQTMQKEIKLMRDELKGKNDLLTGTVHEQSTLLALSEKFKNYLPDQLVESILSQSADTSVKSTRKKLSIFFSDIVGFTRITGELEPEDIAKLLNHYLSEMTAIAKKYNGTVDKFIGDAILIHFGDQGSKGEKLDAIDCVQMAIDMQLKMRELSAQWIEEGFEEPLQIRCGINTGYAAVGNFGSVNRMDYTIIGSNVNLASRIQSHAEVGGILVSHSTWASVRDKFALDPQENITVKGFNRTIPVYRVMF